MWLDLQVYEAETGVDWTGVVLRIGLWLGRHNLDSNQVSGFLYISSIELVVFQVACYWWFFVTLQIVVFGPCTFHIATAAHGLSPVGVLALPALPRCLHVRVTDWLGKALCF